MHTLLWVFSAVFTSLSRRQSFYYNAEYIKHLQFFAFDGIVNTAGDGLVVIKRLCRNMYESCLSESQRYFLLAGLMNIFCKWCALSHTIKWKGNFALSEMTTISNVLYFVIIVFGIKIAVCIKVFFIR